MAARQERPQSRTVCSRHAVHTRRSLRASELSRREAESEISRVRFCGREVSMRMRPARRGPRSCDAGRDREREQASRDCTFRPIACGLHDRADGQRGLHRHRRRDRHRALSGPADRRLTRACARCRPRMREPCAPANAGRSGNVERKGNRSFAAQQRTGRRGARWANTRARPPESAQSDSRRRPAPICLNKCGADEALFMSE